MRGKRVRLIAGLLLLALLGIGLGWLVYVPIRQDRLDRALIAAIKHKDAASVKRLLQQGANANYTNSTQPSLSFWDLLRSLILKRQTTRMGIPAIILAREVDDEGKELPIVQALLEHGADPNVKDRNSYPQINSIIEDTNGDPNWVKLLLDHGTDPNATDADGTTALMYAARSENAKTVKLLIARIGIKGVNTVDQDGKTALYWAADGQGWNDPTIVKRLLEAGADLNIEDKWGKTPLWQATFVDCHAGPSSPAIMRYLLTHGAKVTNSKGHSPLSWAAYGKKVEAMRVLLDAGANPNERDQDGSTPLMEAVTPPAYETWGSVESYVKLLLRRGADPNLKAHDRSTALKIARTAGESKIVRLLKKVGAKE